MARDVVNTGENKGPRQVGGQADHFGVDQVTQADAGAGDTHDDDQAIDHPEVVILQLPTKKPQADQDADGGTVAGQAGVWRHQDVQRVGEEAAGLIEQEVPQAGAQDRADQDIHRQRVHILAWAVLPQKDVIHDLLADDKPQHPHKSIPT